MGRHRRPSARVPWWRLRAEHEKLRRLYAELEDDHVVLVGDLERLKARRPARTSWGLRNEDFIDTQVLPGLPPDQASDLTHQLGLLKRPGGAWPQEAGGTTG